MKPQRFTMPIKGLSERLPVEDSEPATTYYIKNVRAPGALERQIRLAQRPGLDKWSTTQFTDGLVVPIVSMAVVQVVI